MTHPTYADTGEPVLIGDSAYELWGNILSWSIVDRLGESLTDRLARIDDDRLFYRHRHNAIAAWEKLLEEANGN